MMQRDREMQEQMQRQMAEIRVEATAGGGMVTVVMDGAKQLRSMRIDPEVATSDVEMLQDLIVAAVNDANRKVDEKLGGRIVSSEGLLDGDAWGKPADWVDYTGPVDGETVGIAIFSHPKNFRHPCRWHVRTYGLFCANPFGMKDFPQVDHEQGPHTVKNGESLTLRYGVHFHRGTTESADIPSAYQAYLARAK